MNNKLELKLAQYAQKALLYEVALGPKPGLVDRFNNGSHNDMDMFTFIDAINALTPYLYEYCKIGNNHKGSPKDLFKKARQVGYQAELSMMGATQSVNTHKGANFSFAIILSATAYIMKAKNLILPFTQKDTEDIFKYVAAACSGLIQKDFQNLDEKKALSYGEKLYKKYSITGIRGVAEEGYPILTKVVMPYLRKNLKNYRDDIEGVFLHLLVLIMSEAEDTNLIHRGGISSYFEVKQQAKEIYQQSNPATIRVYLKEFDQELIQQHLSPGGAADLLSLSFYLAQLEGLLH